MLDLQTEGSTAVGDEQLQITLWNEIATQPDTQSFLYMYMPDGFAKPTNTQGATQ